jgi:hypothetical protein
MRSAAQSARSPSFASLLAGLAMPAPKPPSAWNDEFADDVTSLSYESALRAHARYRAADASDRSLTQPAAPSQSQFARESSADPFSSPDAATGGAAQQSAWSEPEPAGPVSTLRERDLKSASITIRMSQAECVQLHQRAAEAGLTVSAYLRSCTLEAESLRALVKETIAQVRLSGAGKQAAPLAQRQPWRQRVVKFFASRAGEGSNARA